MEHSIGRRIPCKPEESPTPGSGRWLLVGLLFLGLAVNYIHRGNLSLAAPALMKEFGLTTASMGILLSAFFWSYALMQIPIGWLTDRIGIKQFYAACYAFWCVVCAATALASSFALQVMMRIFLGAGQAMIFPASTRAIAAWFSPAQRGTATGLYLTGSRFGMIVFAPLSASILGAFGWKMLFILTGLPALLWLMPWFWFFRHYRNQVSAYGSAAELGESRNRTEPAGDLASRVDLLKHLSTWGISTGFFCYDYAWYVFITWLPGYLMLERRFSLQQTAIYGSLPVLCMSVMIPISGLLSDRLVAKGHGELRVRKTLLAIGLMVSCLMVPAGLVKDSYACIWLLTLSLTGLGIATPNTWTLTTAIAPANSVGTLAGIQNLAGNVGGILAPALTGYIAHVTGSFAMALMFTGGLLVVGAMAYVFMVPGKISVDNYVR